MAQTLASEIRQSKPFAHLEEEAFLNIVRTAGALLERESALLEEHGLTHAQYNALRILRGAGPDGLPCGEIGNRMVSRDPDITRLLDRMEKRGVAERSRSTEDRRVVTVRITPDGLRLLEAVDGPLSERVRSLLGHLDAADLRTLIDLLERAREKAS